MKKIVLFFVFTIVLLSFGIQKPNNEIKPVAIPKYIDDTTLVSKTLKIKTNSNYGFYSSPSMLVYLTEEATDTITGVRRLREFYADTSLFREKSFLNSNCVNKHIVYSKTGDTLILINYKTKKIVRHQNPKFKTSFNSAILKNQSVLLNKFGKNIYSNISLNLSKTITNSNFFYPNGMPKTNSRRCRFYYNIKLTGGHEFPLCETLCYFDSTKCNPLGKPLELSEIKLTFNEVKDICKKHNLTDSIAPLEYKIKYGSKNKSFRLGIKAIISEKEIQENKYIVKTTRANLNLNSGKMEIIDTVATTKFVSYLKAY